MCAGEVKMSVSAMVAVLKMGRGWPIVENFKNDNYSVVAYAHSL